jgi:hypothetical protein
MATCPLPNLPVPRSLRRLKTDVARLFNALASVGERVVLNTLIKTPRPPNNCAFGKYLCQLPSEKSIHHYP